MNVNRATKSKREMQDATGLTPNAKGRGTGRKPKKNSLNEQADEVNTSDPLQIPNSYAEHSLEKVFPELVWEGMEFVGTNEEKRPCSPGMQMIHDLIKNG